MFPEYNGALLDYLDPSSAASSSSAVERGASGRPTVDAGGCATVGRPRRRFHYRDGAVSPARYHLRTIADLKPIENQVTIGAAPVFATREQGLIGLKRLYGITLKLRLLDESGPLDIAALNDGSIQAADIFTTDPAISRYHFVVLTDPKHLFPAENVTPIINKDVATPLIIGTLDSDLDRSDY